MIELSNCVTCGQVYYKEINHIPEHIYCSKACKEKARMEREKAERRKTPDWKCPGCKTEVRLAFRPIRDHKMWEMFDCPGCGFHPCPDKQVIAEDIRRSVQRDPIV